MNNNYYNFNPNPNFNRNIPVMPINPNMMPNNASFRQASLPRLSSLFGGRAASGVASTGALGVQTASKVTFSSLLNGASKTLGVINQAIPVFYQVKPMWNNAKTMFKVMKEFKKVDLPQTNQINTNDTKTNVNEQAETTTNQSSLTQNKENSNSPTFFV